MQKVQASLPKAIKPLPHCNITHQTHEEDLQWSGGNFSGVIALKCISFGSDLLAKCQSFSQLQSKNWYAMSPMAQ
jgi:hypothetical protein